MEEEDSEYSSYLVTFLPYSMWFLGASIPQFEPEIQVYENIHLARLR